jgi:hypothetical protein
VPAEILIMWQKSRILKYSHNLYPELPASKQCVWWMDYKQNKTLEHFIHMNGLVGQIGSLAYSKSEKIVGPL